MSGEETDVGAGSGTGTSSGGAHPGRHLGQEMSERWGARHAGELPWENGESYLLGQLGRGATVVMVTVIALYLFSPVTIYDAGDAVRFTPGPGVSVVFVLIVIVGGIANALVILGMVNARAWLGRTMVLQTDVSITELGPEMSHRLQEVGATGKLGTLPSRGSLLVGRTVQIRPDYAPLRTVGSRLGYVSWAGGRSLLVVPLPLFRHPKWGQEIDHATRDLLGWARLEQVTTPRAISPDSD